MTTTDSEDSDTPAKRRSRVCEEFAEALEAGQSPNIEEYLVRLQDAERPSLLVCLVREDHLFRREKGEWPTLDDYKARFPNYRDAVERAILAPPSEGKKSEGKDGVRYAFIRKLGEGGQASVFLASDTEARQRGHSDLVAVKVFSGASPRRRFSEEKHFLARVSHQQVVPIIDHFEEAGHFFIVLKYIDGSTLAEQLKERKRIEPQQSARIVAQVARAVDHVHRKTHHEGKAVVHRDIKPANIVLDRDGDPHILDFGIACLTEDVMEAAAGAGGTYEYMSPEQLTHCLWQKGNFDTRTDVWSLGAVLYELLTGSAPFGHRPHGPFLSRSKKKAAYDRFFDKILDWRGTLPFPTPRDLNPSVPVELENVILGCLKQSAEDRVYQTAGSLAQALEQWLEAATLLPTVDDFRAYREEKHRHYSDRPWLRDEILAWPAYSNERTLLITGGFGTGKTAFLSDFVERNPEERILGHHFCHTDTKETLRPSFFVRNLAAMLRDRLPGYSEAIADPAVSNALGIASCEEDPASAFETGILTPLHNLSPPGEGVYYIILDSLDEAMLWRGHPNILDVVCTRAERLPPWLRLVATSRPQPEIRSRFSNVTLIAIDPTVSVEAGEDRAAEIRDDVERYIRSRLETPNCAAWLQHNRRDVDQAATTILEKSEANFLYVKLLFDVLESPDQRAFRDLDDLPRGLDRWFREFFKRCFPNPKADYVAARKLLEVVLAAAEPPDGDLLAAAAGLDRDDELPELLERLSDFVRPWQDDQGAERYSFVHSALAEWLANRERGREYRCNAKKGHERLAEVFWKELEQGLQELPDYPLRHLARHLLGCEDWDHVTGLLTDLRYLEAMCERGLLFDLTTLLRDAWQALPSRHKTRKHFQLIEQAMRRDIQFIHRHRHDYPQGLFQCLWNSCWWYDSEHAGKYYEPPVGGWPDAGPPWSRPNSSKLSGLLERWRVEKERNQPDLAWVRSLRPPPYPLGTALVAVIDGEFVSDSGVVLTSSRDVAAAGGGWDGLMYSCAEKLIRHMDSFEQLQAYGGNVAATAVSPDGRLVARGLSNNLIRLWNNQGEECGVLDGHQRPPSRLAFSENGCRLISGDPEGTIVFWDTEALQRLHEPITAHSHGVDAVAMSKNGKIAVSASRDRVAVWDLEEQRQKYSFSLPVDEVMDVGANMEVLLPDDYRIGGLALSPDVRLLAIGLEGGAIVVCHLTTDEEPISIYLEGGLTALAFSRQGDRMVSCSFDERGGTLRIWEVERLSEYAGEQAAPRCIRMLDDYGRSVGFSRTGRYIASEDVVSRGNTILRIWDPNIDVDPPTLQTSGGSLRFSPDGRHLLSAGRKSSVHVWSGTSGNLRCVLPASTWGIDCVACTLDGRYVIAGSDEGVVRVWELPSGKEVRLLQDADKRGHETIHCLALSSDSRHFVTGGGKQIVRLWDIQKTESIRSFVGAEGPFECVAISLESRRIAAGSWDGTLRVWDFDAGQQLACVSGFERDQRFQDDDQGAREFREPMQTVCFSEDGRYVLGHQRGRIFILDAATGNVIDCLLGNEGVGFPETVALSPDGKKVVLSDEPGTRHGNVRVIDRAELTIEQMMEGYADAQAIASGPSRHPWYAIVRDGQTVIESAVRGRIVASDEWEAPFGKMWISAKAAYFPVEFDRAVATHPNRQIWAGVAGTQLYVVELMGSTG